MCVCVCVCVCARARACVYAHVCGGRGGGAIIYAGVFMCVCVGGGGVHIPVYICKHPRLLPDGVPYIIYYYHYTALKLQVQRCKYTTSVDIFKNAL